MLESLSVARLRRVFIGLAAVCSGALTLPAQAEIVVGQIAPMTGVMAAAGQQIVLGARLWFERVNSQGGVNGEKIRHVVLNDTFKIPETIQQTKDLIARERPAALIGYLGAVTLAELLKDGVLAKNNVAMVAPYSGSPSLHGAENPSLFHVRASYADEIAYMADHLATLGVKRTAILYQDDSFGYTGLASFEAAAAKHGMQIVARGKYLLLKPDLTAAVRDIAAASPQAVVMVATTRGAATFAKGYREAGGGGIMLNVSVVDPTEMIKLSGLDAVRGMGITQIVPYPFTGVSPLLKEFQRDFAQFAPKDAVVTYAVFEEYIGARVLTEALKRAGKNPTAAKVSQTLQTLGRVDLGGFSVEFTPKTRSGSKFVEVVVIGAGGRLLK